MTGTDQSGFDERLGALLSAYLDGEVGAGEETEVRVLLEQSADARRELVELGRVRSLLRGLPEIEPLLPLSDAGLPDGTRERAGALAEAEVRGVDAVATSDLSDAGAPSNGRGHSSRPVGRRDALDERRRRRPIRRVAVAAGVAAVAVVALIGVTPVTDRLVPPVGAFAARHEAMEEHGPAGAPNPAEMAFTELTPGALDQMGMPIEAGPGFRLVHGYQGVGAMLHLVYSNGRAMVSVYEQPGTVRWDDMSGSGTRMDLGGHPALDMRTGTQEVVVVDRGVRVDTLITGTDHDGLMGVAHALPERDQTAMDRVRRVVRTVVESFGGHG